MTRTTLHVRLRLYRTKWRFFVIPLVKEVNWDTPPAEGERFFLELGEPEDLELKVESVVRDAVSGNFTADLSTVVVKAPKYDENMLSYFGCILYNLLNGGYCPHYATIGSDRELFSRMLDATEELLPYKVKPTNYVGPFEVISKLLEVGYA